MPQQPQPWFRTSTSWWMAQINRQQVKFHPGPKNSKTEKLARARPREALRLKELRADPAGRALTMAEVIELYPDVFD